MTDAGDAARPGAPAWCEHGPEHHDGSVPSHASAPAGSRAWLLIEHRGPWAEHAAQTPLPEPLSTAAAEADRLGIRVQLIRRPGRGAGEAPAGVYAGWTAGASPWLRRLAWPRPGGLDPHGLNPHGLDLHGLDLHGLAAGVPPAAGGPVPGPVFLVCAHGRRNACCARYGGPLARALAARYPGQVWETTHVGGHKFAANLVILPHGLYYGPVDLRAASDAIGAYRRGEVTAHRFRGRAGQDPGVQAAEHAELTRRGTIPLG
ncbi:MAG: sucrase ferredoxin [Streptosporangiaceae bacterium]|nr:sucrase ferredoxin [Streptosporangiaceae bacterium]